MSNKKLRILLTGASGNMGSFVLKELLKNNKNYELHLTALNSKEDHEKLNKYKSEENLTIHWGNLTDYEYVNQCVKHSDIVLHVAALVSPAADYNPELAMKINYGSTRNIISSIEEQGRSNQVKVVFIGTVAETGDRMPPIHWGRVGDPIKPSFYDYYAVSKVAAKRLLIESCIENWVSLRQTGIMGPAMSQVQDAIANHNCLNNVLEYVSDRDSGRLLGNLCLKEFEETLDQSFWGHVYNIGGGESCRVEALTMSERLYRELGFTDMNHVIDPKMFAIRNFHGQYYLDSDKLEEYLEFRQDGMEYFYDSYKENLGKLVPIFRFINKASIGQKLLGKMMMNNAIKTAKTQHGTVRFIEENEEQQIKAYWGSKRNWGNIPEDINEFEKYVDWDKIVLIDHGYDENKPESELTLEEMKKAAEFRGGKCLSETMEKGNWKEKLTFKCAFDHEFTASSRLILEGGHWCPVCERESWNYPQRAKVDPFFAQVWTPLYDEIDEPDIEVKKIISELDV